MKRAIPGQIDIVTALKLVQSQLSDEARAIVKAGIEEIERLRVDLQQVLDRAGRMEQK